MKILILYLVFINLLTFAAYGIDKRKAQKNAWRIKESTLLLHRRRRTRQDRHQLWVLPLSVHRHGVRRHIPDPARADRACGMVGFALKNCEKIYIILIL